MDVNITVSLKDMCLHSPKLPLEMIENIIDQGCKDIQLLKTCSLVCQGWLRASRFHLFSSVKHVTITPQNCSTFVRLVHSTHSTLPAFFHTFCPKDLGHNTLASAIKAIQNVLRIQTLVVLGSESVSELLKSIVQCGTLQQTVTCIDLRFGSGNTRNPSSSLRDVFETISSFSALERIDFSGTVASTKKEDLKYITVPSTLNTIQFCMTQGLDAMMNYCLVNNATLTRLRVYNFQAKNNQMFQDYINACTSLRHLTIDYSPSESHACDLSALHALKSIDFAGSIQDPLTSILQILHTITSTQLQEIAITIRSYSALSPTDPWAALDAVLCGKFPALTCVKITTSQLHAVLINEELKECKSRGLLGFKVWGT